MHPVSVGLLPLTLHSPAPEDPAAFPSNVQSISGGWLPSSGILLTNVALNLLPIVLLIAAALTGNRIAMVVMGTLVALQLVYNSAIRMVGFRMPPWTSITYPVGTLLATAILADGMVRVATGREIKWKDRAVMGAPKPNFKRRIRHGG